MKFVDSKILSGSDYLKLKMKRVGYSAHMLAARVGISDAAMQSYMSGRRELGKCEASKLFKLAYNLNADPQKLAFGCYLETWVYDDGVELKSCSVKTMYNNPKTFVDSWQVR